jgi:malate permease and related proteins
VASYWQLVTLVVPVFALVGIGVGVRRAGWIDEGSENGLLRLVVWLTFPCLIFETVAFNGAFRSPAQAVLPPLVGFATAALGMGAALLVARAAGLAVGSGLRTFALSAGMYNYGYLPLPIIGGLFGEEAQAVLLVHNVGVEVAMWSVGMLLVSGASLRDGWRKLINPPVLSVAVALLAAFSGAADLIPGVLRQVIHALALCAVPLGLLMTGSSLEPYLKRPAGFFDPKVTLLALGFRLLLMPLAFIGLALMLPVSRELKQVIIVQGAMPAAVFPIILARVYGGQPQIAAQIVVATTAAGLITIPLWLRLGFAWLG